MLDRAAPNARLAMARHVVDEVPVVVDERPADAVSVGDASDYATLWPRPELHGVDPTTRWVRLSHGSDALLLGWHGWSSGPDARYPVVRLDPAGHRAVRIVPLGQHRLPPWSGCCDLGSCHGRNRWCVRGRETAGRRLTSG